MVGRQALFPIPQTELDAQQMSTGPKLPPLPVWEGDGPLWSSIEAWHLSKDALGAFRAGQAIDESVAAIALAYGLQCFEAGRQQGITEERERREQQDLHDAITAARRNGT